MEWKREESERGHANPSGGDPVRLDSVIHSFYTATDTASLKHLWFLETFAIKMLKDQLQQVLDHAS